MALFKFTKLITEGYPIDVYNNGDMARDFTYIDDLIEALIRLVKCEPTSTKDKLTTYQNDSLSDVAPWRVVNIGSEHPVCLLDFIKTIEKAIGKVAKKNFWLIKSEKFQKLSLITLFSNPSQNMKLKLILIVV